MATKRIQIDISSDIFDKVITFLEKLPKNKVKLNIVKNDQEPLKNSDIFSKTSGLISNKKIDPLKWQEEIRNEWNR